MDKFDYDQYYQYPALKNLLRMVTEAGEMGKRHKLCRFVHNLDRKIKYIQQMKSGPEKGFFIHLTSEFYKNLVWNRMNWLTYLEKRHLQNFVTARIRNERKKQNPQLYG